MSRHPSGQSADWLPSSGEEGTGYPPDGYPEAGYPPGHQPMPDYPAISHDEYRDRPGYGQQEDYGQDGDHYAQDDGGYAPEQYAPQQYAQEHYQHDQPHGGYAQYPPEQYPTGQYRAEQYAPEQYGPPGQYGAPQEEYGHPYAHGRTDHVPPRAGYGRSPGRAADGTPLVTPGPPGADPETAALRRIRPGEEARQDVPEWPDGPGPDDTRWTMLAYLTVPLFGFVVPLAVYLRNLRGSRWSRVHAAQALNVWLTVMLYNVSGVIMGTMLALDSPEVALVIFGPLILALWLVALTVLVRAATAASEGRGYDIPRWLCSPIVR